MKQRLLLLALFVSASSFFILGTGVHEADASHGRFGTIEWVTTDNPGEVIFTVRTVWRRTYWSPLRNAGDAAPNWGTFTFGDGSTISGATNGIVTDHSVSGDWIIIENTWTHIYANPNQTYTAGFSICCRIGSALMVNRWDLHHRVRAMVNPSINSPISSTPPILGVLAESPTTFQIFASDPDGAPLRYRLATNIEATQNSASNARNNPPPNMSIDAETGLVTWDNAGLDADRFWTTQVIVEKLDAPDGDVIAHVPIDFLLQIADEIDNNPPVVSSDPPTPITVELGNTVEFDVTGTDPDEGDEIELASVSLPAGATMNPTLPLSGPHTGVTSTFSWTPGSLGTFFATFVVRDDGGLSSQLTVRIDVVESIDDDDTTPPECRLAEMVRDNGVVTGIRIEVQDIESGISSIEFLNGLNARLEVPEGSDNWLMSGDLHTFAAPTNDLLVLLGEKIDLNERSMIVIEVTDDAGNSTICDPVVATLSAEVPEGYDLGQNYPNPFNPSTYITFQVHEASFVTMHVYDLTGRMVATLVNETLEPGTYSVDWEGKNDFGETVASGVYIYRMSAGEFEATKTMVFMK